MTSLSALFKSGSRCADIFTSLAAGAGVASPSSEIVLEMKNNPNKTHNAVVDPIVDNVLGVLNLHNETDSFLRDNYPTQKRFEKFLKLSVEAGKAVCKENRESKAKEPRFKRRDFEEFILLCKWIKKNQVGGKIKWKNFNEENLDDFREQAPKDDFIKILKELGINNDKVKNALQAKSVRTAADFAQKPRSWYEKLCEEESGTEENSKQTKHFLLSGAEKSEIEKFKDWYKFHSIGYLPSDWIVSFRNDEIDPDERDLRKVLRVIGLKADAIEALKMNHILNIETLNDRSEEWKTQGASSCSTEQASRSYEWKDMGLTRNNASRIINFRHWYNFYVAGKKSMKGWVAEFNSAQYNNFLQRYEPGDDFRKPSWWKFWQKDTLNFLQEKQDYFDMLQRAAEHGDVTEEQRYHLLNYMKKREKMSLIEEISFHHDEGLRDTTPEEDRLRELLHRDDQEADEKDKRDLLLDQKFCQFYLSAFLVLTMLWSWVGTTGYIMRQHLRWGKDVTGYVVVIHNVLFGLVTAVVIQELGEAEKETSLHYRFLPIEREQRRRLREYRILNRNCWVDIWQFFIALLMWVIHWSTRVYAVVWICVGTASFAFGAIKGIDASNPLYTTGQTWLGIAVTIGYTYFGLNGRNALELEDVVQGNIDGSDGASSREDRFIDEREIDPSNNDAAVQAASTLKKRRGKKQVSSAPSFSFVIYNNRNHHDGLHLIDDDEIGLVGNENPDESDDDDVNYLWRHV